MTPMTTEDNNDSLNKCHRLRIQHKKAVVGVKTAAVMDVRNILPVNIDNSKGKSSSGSGIVMRAVGHDMQVGVVRLIRGAIPTDEERLLRRFPEQCSFHVMGEDYIWKTQDRTYDIEKTQAAWAYARELLSDPTVGLVLLDELNITLRYHYLDMQAVLADLCAWLPAQHVMITGHSVPPELIRTADTVTDMMLVRHVFSRGIQAQPGVELW